MVRVGRKALLAKLLLRFLWRLLVRVGREALLAKLLLRFLWRLLVSVVREALLAELLLGFLCVLPLRLVELPLSFLPSLRFVLTLHRLLNAGSTTLAVLRASQNLVVDVLN